MKTKFRTYPFAVFDAFTDKPYSGNPAGVVFLGGEPFPDEADMIRAAAELRFSETAFVRKLSETEFAVRYFTPVCEAALCGHATVASFAYLRDKKLVGYGDVLVRTKSGDICVTVSKSCIELDMAEVKTLSALSADVSRELYRAFGLPDRASVNGLVPKIVSVGLADVMLPVYGLGELDSAKQDEAAVGEISRRLSVTGVHMFAISDDGFAAHCRNFAPLYGIPEECATGTSNGALYHYLSEYGLVSGPVRFIQGEAMGRPSVISVRFANGRVRVGGNAAEVSEGRIRI
ncbi:MAG: PhzF family phenazine biosynthesis protein [Clostridia bacterium]|nr:PhzF family phenazine biosynthesis protein [Clostridia bacterium]